jgi:hypothetical protein
LSAPSVVPPASTTPRSEPQRSFPCSCCSSSRVGGNWMCKLLSPARMR